jgi:large subunit ribosomal protein L9
VKKTKVILNQDVYNLGEEGDVREVAPGYARNFLIPQGLAVSFNKQNLAQFEQKREVIEKRKEEKRDVAKGLRERIESREINLEMPAGDTGKLFGSVNSATIVERLAADGISIERKKIDVPDNSIKMVGEYTVRIRLYGDEVAELKVTVDPVGGKKKAAKEEKSAGASARAERRKDAEPTSADAAAAEVTPAEATPAEAAAAEANPAEATPAEAAAAEPASAEPTEAPDSHSADETAEKATAGDESKTGEIEAQPEGENEEEIPDEES